MQSKWSYQFCNSNSVGNFHSNLVWTCTVCLHSLMTFEWSLQRVNFLAEESTEITYILFCIDLHFDFYNQNKNAQLNVCFLHYITRTFLKPKFIFGHSKRKAFQIMWTESIDKCAFRNINSWYVCNTTDTNKMAIVWSWVGANEATLLNQRCNDVHWIESKQTHVCIVY